MSRQEKVLLAITGALFLALLYWTFDMDTSLGWKMVLALAISAVLAIPLAWATAKLATRRKE